MRGCSLIVADGALNAFSAFSALRAACGISFTCLCVRTLLGYFRFSLGIPTTLIIDDDLIFLVAVITILFLLLLLFLL